LFPLRKCDVLPKKPCLYYHLHQCLGPCFKTVLPSEYEVILNDINDFFKNKYKKVILEKKNLLKYFIEEEEYEKAQEVHDLLKQIENITQKQKVQLEEKIDMDVFNYEVSNDVLAVAILNYQQGILINKDSKIFESINPIEAFITFVYEWYQSNKLPKLILLPNQKELLVLKNTLESKVIFPKYSNKFDLISLAKTNALKALQDNEIYNSVNVNFIKLLNNLSSLLQINNIRTIELIDNSQLQGDTLVSGVVVFINGKPAKSLYRRYNIDKIEHTDDYHLMKEVLKRRFKRILIEGNPINDLLLLDGGLPQLSAAQEIKEELKININLASLVKNDKHQTRGLFNEKREYIEIIDNDLLNLLKRMQDEVHRFVISFHRTKRRKALTTSILDNISGIGKKRRNELLKHFSSVSAIFEASEAELKEFLPLNVIKELKKNK
jgi:excinuclease ABC subunit C